VCACPDCGAAAAGGGRVIPNPADWLAKLEDSGLR
jgi:hypothetical protein